jgi:hypothetical protein
MIFNIKLRGKISRWAVQPPTRDLREVYRLCSNYMATGQSALKSFWFFFQKEHYSLLN